MSNSTAVTVKVVVRVRPQNKIETARGGAPCVEISADGTEVAVEDGYNSQKWSFDRVFKPAHTFHHPVEIHRVRSVDRHVIGVWFGCVGHVPWHIGSHDLMT